jgi:hypothetical protein
MRRHVASRKAAAVGRNRVPFVATDDAWTISRDRGGAARESPHWLFGAAFAI